MQQIDFRFCEEGTTAERHRCGLKILTEKFALSGARVATCVFSLTEDLHGWMSVSQRDEDKRLICCVRCAALVPLENDRSAIYRSKPF